VEDVDSHGFFKALAVIHTQLAVAIQAVIGAVPQRCQQLKLYGRNTRHGRLWDEAKGDCI